VIGSSSDDETPPGAAPPQVGPKPVSAETADLVALAGAVLEAVNLAFRTAPEMRSSRVLERWPFDPTDLVVELRAAHGEVPFRALATRLGVSRALLRSTALRLQRMGFVAVKDDAVALSAKGRQRIARFESARSAALQRMLGSLSTMPVGRVRDLIAILRELLERIEESNDNPE
jgi:hypothetical protein